MFGSRNEYSILAAIIMKRVVEIAVFLQQQQSNERTNETERRQFFPCANICLSACAAFVCVCVCEQRALDPERATLALCSGAAAAAAAAAPILAAYKHTQTAQ